MAALERTLVLLKPDAVARGLVGRIIQRFEEAALKIVGTKMVQMDADLAKKHSRCADGQGRFLAGLAYGAEAVRRGAVLPG